MLLRAGLNTGTDEVQLATGVLDQAQGRNEASLATGVLRSIHTLPLECVAPTDGGGGVWRMGFC